MNFLFNAHPRAATAANGKHAILSLAIIDACGKSYTAIASGNKSPIGCICIIHVPSIMVFCTHINHYSCHDNLACWSNGHRQ